MDRRTLLTTVGSMAMAGCAGSPGVVETTTTGGTLPATGTADDESQTTPSSGGFSVTSSAFANGASIPRKYTADGADVSPPLTVRRVPEDAATLAVVMTDPDADGFVHWLLWNVPAERTHLPEGVPREPTVASLDGARQGTNDFGVVGYRGPKPPKGDGPHTYRFTVYAVASSLDVEAGATLSTLRDALDGSTLAQTRLTGEYDR